MRFALRVLEVVDALPGGTKGWAVARQLSRCGTAVAANYRAAARAKSPKDFIHKMGTVEEEADETLFWLELTSRAGLLPEERLTPLMGEANELTSIFVASIRTARARQEAK